MPVSTNVRLMSLAVCFMSVPTLRAVVSIPSPKILLGLVWIFLGKSRLL